eukprot:1334229-Prymnesium_polylepis.2
MFVQPMCGRVAYVQEGWQKRLRLTCCAVPHTLRWAEAQRAATYLYLGPSDQTRRRPGWAGRGHDSMDWYIHPCAHARSRAS